jgi:5-methylcytosine-specific restriction endonuclease McrA
MAVSKKIRQAIYERYGGLCAYTGKPLGEDWQIDHIHPVCKHRWDGLADCPDRIENLAPTIKIINHYKRAMDLEQWRGYMLTFHTRLKKLPKKTIRKLTIKRIAYMNQVADLFGISPTVPFCGTFYFEKAKANK